MQKRSSTVVALWLLFGGLLLPAWAAPASETNSWSLASPDGRCVISVSLDEQGELSYEVRRGGNPVLLKSPLGLNRDDEAFARGLTLQEAGTVECRREAYELLAGIAPQVDHTLNRRSLVFHNLHNAALILDLAASDQGVAFRYRFADHSAKVRVVQAELTGFALPGAARGWLQPYHVAGPYTPAYEDFYFPVSPGERPPDSRAKALGWGFPALFQVAKADTWVLLTESGTDASYCGCHLGPDSPGGLYRIAFPAADEATKGQTNSVGPEPRWTLPWTMPWRVLVLGQSAGAIALNTLVTDLAPPSRIQDTSWIHPGRASWAWWTHAQGPPTAQLFNKFSDFGARMHWEYTLFDAGWWKPGLKGIARHARAEGLTPLAWLFAGDFYTAASRKQKLDEMEAAGVRGVKVDFWCCDRQEAIAAMQALLADAAARRMVVNLHGCTIPRGWQRTWPNLLSMEAVLGRECYFFEPAYTEKAAELDTVLPFTRNAIGPMDDTPVGCTPQKYARTTTAAHELAAALVFTSGIIHYADSPEFFESLPPQALQVLRDAPARWAETRCLMGEPGKRVVFARRAGNTWFIAGINGTKAPVATELDLGPFRNFPHRIAIAEGTNPLMQVKVTQLDGAAAAWRHQMPARGGFILRLDR